MAEFKRGDVVMYNVRERRGMQHWKHINGAVGVVERTVERVGIEPDDNRGPGAFVTWVGQMGTSDRDLLDNHKPYPDYLLEKVGHIELPEVPHG